MDYTALKNEIQNDPANIGYAAHVAVGNDQEIANLLNIRNHVEVLENEIDKGTFQFQILPAVLVLPTLSDDLQRKWDRILSIINSVSTIKVSDPRVQGTLDLAVGDGLLTTEQRNAVGMRMGSRAEFLFGTDTLVTHADVAIALRQT